MKVKQRLALTYIRARFRVLTLLSKKKAAQQAFALFQTPTQRRIQALTPLFKKAESLHFKIGDISVTGWRWNKGGGKKVLVVHGFESSVTSFELYISSLIEKNYEVIAFDAPAHGRSEGKHITLPLYKRMIQMINEKYGPINSYLAHSFGGLATVMALEEISHTKENKLVLIAPATETETAIDVFFNVIKIGKGPRKHFDDIVTNLEGHAPSWYSINRAIRTLNTKVMWFHDEDDDTTPLKDIVRIMEDRLTHLEFVITKGLGHRRIYRDKKVHQAAIDFL